MEQLISLVEGFTILTLVKGLLVTLLGVYVVFAGLMTVQIKAMTKAVTMRDDYIIRGLGILNFSFAILVFLLSVFIL